MKHRAISFVAAHRLSVAAFTIMWLGIAWAMVALPTIPDVPIECVRSGPRDLKITTIIGDAGFVLAYLGMPIRLVLTWFRIRVRPIALLVVLFGAFIFLCGPGTHGLKIAMFWWPQYWISAKVSLVGAGVSLMTWHALEIRVPEIRALSTMASDLQHKNAELQRIGDENKRLREEAEARAQSAEDDAKRERDGKEELQRVNAQLEALTEELRLAKQRSDEKVIAAGTHVEDLEALLAESRANAEKIRAQSQTIAELGAFVLPVNRARGIAVMPIIGCVDSIRAQHARDCAAASVERFGLRTLIVDLRGVPIVDTMVATEIVKLVRVVEIVGAKCILSGIGAAVAMSLVELGESNPLAGIRTCTDLDNAIELAMKKGAVS